VSSPSTSSKKETLWISVRDHLIRKHRRSIEPPAGGPAAPTADQQGMKALPMKGSTTEVHGAVGSPLLGAVDFAYAPPPAGAALKASLFEMPAELAKPEGDEAGQVEAAVLALGGRNLSAQEAESLEKLVAEHPDDIAARTRLLGYYFRASADGAKRPHVLWLIENAPESGLPFGEWTRGATGRLPAGKRRERRPGEAAAEPQAPGERVAVLPAYDPELARRRSSGGGSRRRNPSGPRRWSVLMLQVGPHGAADAAAAAGPWSSRGGLPAATGMQRTCRLGGGGGGARPAIARRRSTPGRC
jgi:hypothetical protein